MSIKVLIVDDSPTCRAILKKSLQSNPAFEVMGTASTPEEARDIIIKEQPDVISLDVEMPGMNGLQFLEKIMRRRPIPVVMTSSLTPKGADIAVTSLQMGAFDCFFKEETPPGADPFEKLHPMLIAAAQQRMGRPRPPKSASQPACQNWGRQMSLIVMGGSTGGVEAIETVLSAFPQDVPPVVVVQHMPAMFVTSFAARLNKSLPLDVAPTRDGEILKNGHVRIATGDDAHIAIEKCGQDYLTRRKAGPLVSNHRPAVDVLFASAARQAGEKVLGIILTGMGSDGAQGLLDIRQAGGLTIGEDRETSMVYGMPRAAKQAGAVTIELPLQQIAGYACRDAK